jgi:hypothetical protein
VAESSLSVHPLLALESSSSLLLGTGEMSIFTHTLIPATPILEASYGRTRPGSRIGGPLFFQVKDIRDGFFFFLGISTGRVYGSRQPPREICLCNCEHLSPASMPLTNVALQIYFVASLINRLHGF